MAARRRFSFGPLAIAAMTIAMTSMASDGWQPCSSNHFISFLANRTLLAVVNVDFLSVFEVLAILVAQEIDPSRLLSKKLILGNAAGR